MNPAHEIDVAALGFVLTEEEGKRGFAQPCPRFCFGSCSIYESRPVLCREYRCSLLQDVESGTTSASDARAKIALAKTLLAQIAEVSPKACTSAERASAWEELKSELEREHRPEERRRLGRAILNIATLEQLIATTFKRKKSA